MNGKLIIFSAPSGAGKSSVVGKVLPQFNNLEFSISAASRAPRGEEIDGEHYHFLGIDGFKKAIGKDAFLEWEEVYHNQFYGTLKSEVDRIWAKGHHVVFDIDVVGGLNLKKQFGDKALAIFIQPPSFKELERRLRGRETDSEEQIKRRLAKAEEEMEKANEFDVRVLNDNLEDAVAEAKELISNFIATK